MDNFIQEIEEDLRRDRLMAHWQKYGRFAVAVALLTVIIVAGVLFWRQYSDRQRQETGLAYMAALDLMSGQTTPEQTVETALPALRKVAQDGTAAYAALARLQAARLLLKAGKTDEAVSAYQSLASDNDVDPLFRDLATLLLALQQADSADPQSLIGKLAPLTVTGNPWRYSALEITALLAQRANETARARESYAAISDDPGAPRQMRARAAEMLAALDG